MAEVPPVYRMAQATLRNAEHLLEQAAKGDQDEMLGRAMSAICYAAVVCARLGDPLGAALLGYLEQRLKDSNEWCALARGRARLEHALSTVRPVETSSEMTRTVSAVSGQGLMSRLVELRGERHSLMSKLKSGSTSATIASCLREVNEQIASLEARLPKAPSQSAPGTCAE